MMTELECRNGGWGVHMWSESKAPQSGALQMSSAAVSTALDRASNGFIVERVTNAARATNLIILQHGFVLRYADRANFAILFAVPALSDLAGAFGTRIGLIPLGRAGACSEKGREFASLG